jgi:hypothetical protein
VTSATPCETAHRRVDATRQPLAMLGHFPSVGLDGTLSIETVLRIWPRPCEDFSPRGHRTERSLRTVSPTKKNAL